MKKLLILFLILVIPVSVFAAKKDKEKPKKAYPTGCDRVGYHFSHGVLELEANSDTTPQAIYFIHNISNKKIRFHQIRSGDKPYIIHSNNSLLPNKWAVYATDRNLTKFICTLPSKRNSHGKILDCEKILKICQYPKVKFALNNRGNYWATTNKSRNSAVRTVIRQGILLKW